MTGHLKRRTQRRALSIVYLKDEIDRLTRLACAWDDLKTPCIQAEYKPGNLFVPALDDDLKDLKKLVEDEA